MKNELFGRSIADDLLAQQRKMDEALNVKAELIREGERLRDEGMARSADHSESAVPDWQELAFKVASRFILKNKGRDFTADQVRKWAESYEFPVPPDNRAWGAVYRRLKNEGLIVWVRFIPSTDPKQHRAPSNLWRAK